MWHNTPELDLAREQVSVLLAQVEEGRAGTRELEEARLAENERFLAWYAAKTRSNARA